MKRHGLMACFFCIIGLNANAQVKSEAVSEVEFRSFQLKSAPLLLPFEIRYNVGGNYPASIGELHAMLVQVGHDPVAEGIGHQLVVQLLGVLSTRIYSFFSNAQPSGDLLTALSFATAQYAYVYDNQSGSVRIKGCLALTLGNTLENQISEKLDSAQVLQQEVVDKLRQSTPNLVIGYRQRGGLYHAIKAQVEVRFGKLETRASVESQTFRNRTFYKKSYGATNPNFQVGVRLQNIETRIGLEYPILKYRTVKISGFSDFSVATNAIQVIPYKDEYGAGLNGVINRHRISERVERLKSNGPSLVQIGVRLRFY